MQTNLIQIPLAKPIVNKEMREATINALLNEHFVLGESVFKFEEEFARYCGVDYAISTNSGTNALQIGLAALGITSGHFVLTSPATFPRSLLPQSLKVDWAAVAFTSGHLTVCYLPAPRIY